MVPGDIQGFEIIIVVFHFRAFHYLIAHSHEDSFHLFQGNGVGMTVAHLVFPGRKGNVNDLFLHFGFPDGGFHFLLRFFQHGFDFRSGIVHHLSDFRPLLGCHVLHTLQNLGKSALFTQSVYPNLVQLIKGSGSFHLLSDLFLDLFQSVFHKNLLLPARKS